MRYGNNLRFKIEVDDEAQKAHIPKMTFQPLVENAIYHGLKLKEGLGSINISGHVEDWAVIIRIEDTGIGMDEEAMNDLRARLDARIKDGESEGHFGVYSADHRLKLYFGEEYGLSFESEYGKGTVVTIKIPYT